MAAPRLLPQKLALHNVGDVEGLCRSILERKLGRSGGYLDEHKYEDALTYLIGVAFELSRVYRRGHGLEFSTYATRILQARVVDWYRETFVDTRYADSRPDLVSLEGLRERVETFDIADRSHEQMDDALTDAASGRVAPEEEHERIAVGC